MFSLHHERTPDILRITTEKEKKPITIHFLSTLGGESRNSAVPGGRILKVSLSCKYRRVENLNLEKTAPSEAQDLILNINCYLYS